MKLSSQGQAKFDQLHIQKSDNHKKSLSSSSTQGSEIKQIIGYRHPARKAISEKYHIIDQIYSYDSNKVYLIQQKATFIKLIAKITPIFQKQGSKHFHQLQQLKFIQNSKKTQTKHLVKMQQTVDQEMQRIFVMEYACGGDLTQHISSNLHLCTKKQMIQHLNQIKNILWQIILGLQEIHKLSYVYRDLKPSNILVSHTGQLKLCDFGLVTQVGIIDPSLCGTPQYMPPQRLGNRKKSLPVDYSIDMWSLGIVAYQLLMGKTPYLFNSDVEELLDQIYSGYIYFQEKHSQQIKNFIANCLRPNPSKRLTLQKAKQHPLFKDIQKENIFQFKCSCQQYKNF